MKRFFQRIQAKAMDHGQAPVLIVAFGDSVTEGSFQKDIWGFDKVYHFLVQRMLEQFFPSTTFSTINSGFGGDSATRSLVRVERDIVRYQPDLVYVAFGLNDSLEGEAGKEAFRASLQTILQTTRQKTDADILLITPPCMAKESSYRVHKDHESFAQTMFNTQNSGMLDAYAEIIREVACEKNVCLADVHEEWNRLGREGFDTDQWLINGLNHPCEDGHRFGAAVIFNALMRVYDKYRNQDEA